MQNGQIEFAKRCIGSKEEIRAIVWQYSIAQVHGRTSWRESNAILLNFSNTPPRSKTQ